MKINLVFFAAVLSLNLADAQENKVLTGSVISEELKLLPLVYIYNIDTVLLGHTDEAGNFEIRVPASTTELLMVGAYLGVERTKVKIGERCEEIEIVMMTNWIYDFISIRKINKKRFMRFKKLHKIHEEAFKQGIFQSEEPCVQYIFSRY